jgi:hypothetical protein
MGFSILLDLAILLGFAVGALMARSHSARLACSLILFALVSVDLLSQVTATAADRLILDATYPLLYSAMLLKNSVLFALSVYALARAIDFPHRETIHAGAAEIAHPAI